MNTFYKSAALFILFLCLAGCAGGNQSAKSRDDNMIRGLDNLIAVIGEKAALQLSEKEASNLAVYYFTAQGEESPHSDYLINGLTTEMANRVPPGYTVVSRQGLDRIMDEYSFQLSDLVSEETQVDIGELLGADTIITGFITEYATYSNINIQIIDVHSGAVISGFRLDYRSGEEKGNNGSSEVVTMERQYVETIGVATVTVIHENFDGPISEVSPGYYDEHWGERILHMDGITGVDPEGYAFLDFTGSVDSTDFNSGWEDSDMNFYMDLPLRTEIGAQQGLYMKIRPGDFSMVYIFAKQEQKGEVTVFGSPVTLNPGVWNEIRIPFANLRHIDGAYKLMDSAPVTLTVGIPYLANAGKHHFQERDFSQRLSIDEVGLYTLKNEEEQNTISSFESEVLDALPSFHIYYSNAAGGLTKPEGVVDYSAMRYTIEEEGPVGRYLSLAAALQVNPAVEDFLNQDGEIMLVCDFLFSLPPGNSEAISFLANTAGVSSAYMYLTNPGKEWAFESGFRSGGNWSRVSIPFRDKIYDEGETGAAKNDPLNLRIIWPIPTARIKEAASGDGTLGVQVNLDELSWD